MTQVLRCAVYARVSTDDQNCERQIAELKAWASRQGLEVCQEVRETESGANDSRKLRNGLLRAAKARLIDCILVTEASRWSRSTSDLLSTLSDLIEYGVSLRALNGIDMDLRTPHGRLIATVLAAIAEFERGLICERVKSGLANAKRRGKRLGRAPGHTPTQNRHRDAVVELRSSFNMPIRKIAAQLAIAPNTVRSILAKKGVD